MIWLSNSSMNSSPYWPHHCSLKMPHRPQEYHTCCVFCLKCSFPDRTQFSLSLSSNIYSNVPTLQMIFLVTIYKITMSSTSNHTSLLLILLYFSLQHLSPSSIFYIYLLICLLLSITIRMQISLGPSLDFVNCFIFTVYHFSGSVVQRLYS